MRILHILHRSIPGTHGYAIRSREIVNNQLAVCLEPMVITSPSQAPAGKLDAEQSETLDGIRYFRTSGALLPASVEVDDQGAFRSALRIVQNSALLMRTVAIARTYRPAVIHAHSPFTCGLIGDAVGRSLGTPSVYEIRGLWEDSHTSRHRLSTRSLRYRGVRSLETLAARNADKVCVISEALRREMMERGVPDQRIFLAPNGVDVTRFQPGDPSEALSERLGLRNCKVIGYIGSFFTYEGLDLLAQAFVRLAPELPDVRLLLVGDGELTPTLRRIVEEGGVGDRAVFTGKVKHSEVDEYYKLCDVMALPRRDTRETRLVTPLKPMEIMAMERALLVSDIGGHREIVIQGENGRYFAAEDVKDLTDKLRDMLTHDEQRRDLAAKGRAWVERNRDWSALVNTYVEVYKALSERRG